MFATKKIIFPHRTHDNNNINNNKFGSWRSFSRRSYFSRDTRDIANPDGVDRRRAKLNKIWIYVGIAIVYLLIIGIVVVVLVLAPRYPSYYNYYAPPDVPISSVEVIPPAQQDIVTDFQSPPGKPFMPSPKDPILYDINPRSDMKINATAITAQNDNRLRTYGQEDVRIGCIQYFS